MSKILIVEDEESIAELEKDYLELSGFEVEIENNGLSLIHIYKQVSVAGSGSHGRVCRVGLRQKRQGRGI